jgi:lysophospholipase L1-like esterase
MTRTSAVRNAKSQVSPVALLFLVATSLPALALVKVGAIGDSNTRCDGYPARMASVLSADTTVACYGVSGQRVVNYEESAMFTQVLTDKPDIVTIMLGTNDAATTTWSSDRATFITKYNHLVDTLKKSIPGITIIPVLPPPAFSMPFWAPGSQNGQVMDTGIVPTIIQVCATNGLVYADWHDYILDRPYMLQDGVHLNWTGHDTLAAFLVRAVRKQLPPISACLARPYYGDNFTVGDTVLLAARPGPDNVAAASKIEFYRVKVGGDSLIGAGVVNARGQYELKWRPAGTDTFTVRAKLTTVDARTALSVSAPITVFPVLAAPWVHRDIGAMLTNGAAAAVTSAVGVGFSLRTASIGYGSNSGNNQYSDDFSFVNTGMSGDGTVTVRVRPSMWSGNYATAGVMVRQDTAPGSPFAAVNIGPRAGTSFLHRDIASSSTATTTAQSDLTAWYTAWYQSSGSVAWWLRISRSGSTFTGSWSTDGAVWSTIAASTQTMPADVLVGVMVHGDNNWNPMTATLDQITVSASATPTTTAPTPRASARTLQPRMGRQYDVRGRLMQPGGTQSGHARILAGKGSVRIIL